MFIEKYRCLFAKLRIVALDDSKDFRNIIQHNEIFGFKHKVK